MINKRFGTSITRTCTYPGADVPSDHVLLKAELKIKLTNMKKQKQRPRIDYDRLKDENIKDRVAKKLNEALTMLVRSQSADEETLDDTWRNMEKQIMDVAQKEIGYEQKIKRKNWMTNDILAMFEDRRKYKCQGNQNEYRRLQNAIRREIRVAKNRWLKEQCEELERLQERHDDYNLHRKLKEVAGIYRKVTFSNIQDEQEQMAHDIGEKKAIWERYIGTLFADERPQLENDLEGRDDLSGPTIITEEIIRALKTSKMGKQLDQIRYRLRCSSYLTMRVLRCFRGCSIKFIKEGNSQSDGLHPFSFHFRKRVMQPNVRSTDSSA